MGVPEFEDAARVLCSREKESLSNDLVGQRILWSSVLDGEFVALCRTSGHFTQLPDMVRVYLSALDSTGSGERHLGVTTDVLAKASGPLQEDGDTTHDIVEVNLDGPDDESGIANRRADAGEEGPLELTEFGLSCARLWLERHPSRRFNCYRPRSKAVGMSTAAVDKQTTFRLAVPRKGSWRWAKHNQHRCRARA